MKILSLGEKIKKRRKELNMTLKDLAANRITPGQISLIESGKSNPSKDLLEYLADKLDVSIEYLIESEKTQAERVCLYYEDIARFHIINKDLMLGEQYLDKALHYAEKYELEYIKAKNLYLKGIIYVEKGELTLAQQFIISANVVFIKDNYYEDIINSFLKLGNITLNLKSYESAIGYFTQAEKVYMDNDIYDDFLIGQIYFFIALTYFKLDDLEKSMNYSYLAKEKFIKIDNKKEYAKSVLLIAEEENLKGNTDNAIKYVQKAISILKDVNDLEYLADIENQLGRLFFEFENLEESFIHLNKSKEIREKNKDGKLIDTLENICKNYIKLKDIKKSKETLEEIKQYLDSNDKELLINYYMLKYKVDILDENISEAEKTLFYALNYAESIGDYHKAAEISILIGKFYLNNNDEKEAANYLNRGVGMLKEERILK